MVYSKRAAFLIKNSHLTVYSGIGQFARSFVEMCDKIGVFVDIITDNPPKSAQKELLESIKTENFATVCSEEILSYNKHNQTFIFSESINLELVLNFRNSLLAGMKNSLYDLVIINAMEAAYGMYSLDIVKNIPTIIYTHNESSIDLKPSNVFSDTYLKFFDMAMRFDNVHIGTQSDENVAVLNRKGFERVSCLPLGFTEMELLEKTETKKNGILFIGRFEDRKNPKVFINAVKQLNMRALVMTNTRGAKGFKDAFNKEGITDYEILENGVGQKKIDFIRKAQIAFHPSKLESFGLCALETLAECPTVLLEEYSWWKNFKGFDVITATSKNYLEILRQSLGKEHDVKANIQNYVANTRSKWQNFIDENKVEFTNVRVDEKIEDYLSTKSYFTTHQYYFDILKRDEICIDDVKSLLKKSSKKYKSNTKEGTVISNGPIIESIDSKKESVDWV